MENTRLINRTEHFFPLFNLFFFKTFCIGQIPVSAGGFFIPDQVIP